MRSFRRRRSTVRTSRFEAFEPRIVMSAASAGELFLGDFVEHVQQEIDPLAAPPDLTGLAQARSAYGLTGEGQTVVVIDSGIAYRHAALGGGYGAGYRVVGGYDFAERDDNPYDDGPFGAHGTHVAGIVASSDGAYPGVAPGVDLVALRVFDDAGRGQFYWVEEALRWVHEHRGSFEHPITTVNLSLGSAWNSDSPPPWASLEDELAQLKADGIFIAVAAGNSFTTYYQPGLSYPAASAYVVPVSSVDGNGQLSYFSQRHDRAIAAPGRGIVSTVPDYLGNGNGIDDDFAAFSGTSMAAPYVAAASVLLREAYQIVGISSVGQDALVNLMRSTADTIYDAVTGQYYLRLNVGRALDAIMPADDYGSDAAGAHSLGTVTDTLSFSGIIGRLDDRDYFRFTAGQSGKLTLTAATTHQLQASWDVASLAGVVEQSENTISFDAVAGRTYTVGLGTQDGLGRYTVELRLQSVSAAEDSAPGGQSAIRDNAINAAGSWFTLSAVNTGIFTVEAMLNAAAGDVDLELFGANYTYLGGSYGTGGYERIDVPVTAGQTLYLHAYLNGRGTNGDVDLRITNLVCQIGDSVQVLGTDGDDVFQFSAGSVVHLSINGVAYHFDGQSARSFEFQGFGGSDAAVLEGTGARDVATLAPGSAVLEGSGYQVQVAGTESILARGGGGPDWAALLGSAFDDVLQASPEAATLSGKGFTNRIEGFSVVRAFGLEGNDTAFLSGSSARYVLVARDDVARLYGRDFSLYARGFKAVEVQAGPASAQAGLFDSAADDAPAPAPRHAKSSGDGFSYAAMGFLRDAVYSLSLKRSFIAGGSDTVAFDCNDGWSDNDVFLSGPTASRFDEEPDHRAKCVEEVYARAGAADNPVSLFDANDDDRKADETWEVDELGQFHTAAGTGRRDMAEVVAVDLVLNLVGSWQ